MYPVLDTHAEDVDEIHQLASEMGGLKGSRSPLSKEPGASRVVKCSPKDSVSSIGSVVDPVP